MIIYENGTIKEVKCIIYDPFPVKKDIPKKEEVAEKTDAIVKPTTNQKGE